MSLVRQIWLLLLATLLVALAASVTVNVGSARATLQTQLALKNSDNATALAQVLSQQKGDADRMGLVAAAQFDTGFYRSIRLTGVDGRLLFERVADARPLKAPGWFIGLVPIDSVPGVAQVSDGWRAIGRLEVISQTAYAHDELWSGSLRAAFALLLVGLLAGSCAALGVQRIRRPLDRTILQAAALERGEYLVVAEPGVPELRRLARAMNSMVERLRTVFEAQATQVEAMRRQVSCDALTGLANRTHFMAALAAALTREDGPAEGGLVLLRVLDLAGTNRRLGRVATDALIVRLAEALDVRVQARPGARAGRLNGSDFALALPLGGIALDDARALVDELRATLVYGDGAMSVAAGAVETRHGATLASVMGAADLALAKAEGAGAYAVQAAGGDAGWAVLGERGWRERVRDALADGRVRLAAFPVIDAGGRLIHLECPARLQLDPGGPFQVAAYWLPLAIRSQLTAEVDERALALALSDIVHDGRPRCVNLSPASLADSGFAARLRTVLETMPREARSISLEISEAAAADQFELVQELARQVRVTGARFGLEHAGERLGRIERLFEAGLDYVKLDASIGHGVAADAQRAGFVQGLVTLLHGLGLQAIVEGVADADDARVLWRLGVDGITGPVVGR